MSSNSITVAVRVRPPNDWESDRLPLEPASDSIFMGDGHLSAPSPVKVTSSKSLRPIVQVMDDKVLIFDPKDPDATRSFEQRGFAPPGTKRYKDQRYTFDRVFNEDARQIDLFEGTTKPLLDGVLDGFNATVFAYGATGCGKTHTISGTDEDPGIIYLTMAELFQKIEDRKDELLCEVSLSFLEIYNEEIRDLLAANESYIPRGGLAIREDQKNRVTVAGLVEKRPANADEVKEMVLEGNSRRTQSPTHANQTSSRSHAVLQVTVSQTPRTASTTEERTTATLSIIDLAGSERASATTNMGQRMIEGANINKSLLALGNCINALCESGNRTRHVPYRNSKLTRLLKFSLGGNCKTVMIVCIAPASNHFEDTQNTLKYANRAKDIKTKVSRNYINVDRHVGRYVEAIQRLNDEVAELKAKIAGKLGAEADIIRRKKVASKAELERVRADIAVKTEQTQRAIVEGAACEANLIAAESRATSARARLGELAVQNSTTPLTPDLLAEQTLLRTFIRADEEMLKKDSTIRRHLQRAENSNSMYDATLRAVVERRSDRLDENAVEVIRSDAKRWRAEMDKLRAETKEGVLKAALTSQAAFSKEMVSLLARCTVLMADGATILTSVLEGGESLLQQTVRDVSVSLNRLVAANDQSFAELVGATTSEFQSTPDSAFLSFASHAPLSSSFQTAQHTSVSSHSRRPSVSSHDRSSSVSSHHARPSTSSHNRLSLSRPRSSIPPSSRRRSSFVATAAHIASPRRHHSIKSPHKSLTLRPLPLRRAIEPTKKSVRWRDETSKGNIEMSPSPSKPVSAPPIPPLPKITVQPSPLGAPPLRPAPAGVVSESEGEWEDERTEDSFSSFGRARVSSAPGPFANEGAVPEGSSLPLRKRNSKRLDLNYLKTARPVPMSSLGEEDEDTSAPQLPPIRPSPLRDVVNSPPRSPSSSYESLGVSKTKFRPGYARSPSTPPQQQYSLSDSLSTPTRDRPLRTKANPLPSSATKPTSRRRSVLNIPTREVRRRRSSGIPRLSPLTKGASQSSEPYTVPGDGGARSPVRKGRRKSNVSSRPPPSFGRAVRPLLLPPGLSGNSSFALTSGGNDSFSKVGKTVWK